MKLIVENIVIYELVQISKYTIIYETYGDKYNIQSGGKYKNIALSRKLMVKNIVIYGLMENIKIYAYLWNLCCKI